MCGRFFFKCFHTQAEQRQFSVSPAPAPPYLCAMAHRFKNRSLITLEQFIVERENDFPHANGEFSQLIRDLSLASKIVNREVNRAGLADIMGFTGDTNVQGESVKKLDVFSNDCFIEALAVGGQVCAVASEENDDLIILEGRQTARYIVAIDPLDGSSNIENNVSIGTIFSIYRRADIARPVALEEVLQPGVKQVAAGYVIYGSSTMLVYTTGNGVNGFTLDPGLGEFILSHPNLQIPEWGKTYSMNEGGMNSFPEGVRRYAAWVKEPDKATQRPYSARYIGSLVADFHRNMLTGGIFIYPGTADKPEGKLRLLYECNPLAFIAEQAGGVATNGVRRIMELQPGKLHQRTPLFIGSKGNVMQVMEMLAASTANA